ncbi:hypothetical protein BGZ50_005234 [Haplosporangium sp. Z 11]|nr:hypothetical protein BGZ50_005234 [Haplosporangium sp. Z 11]
MTISQGNTTTDNTNSPPRPQLEVLIVGAGLGGLLMGILLERMDIPYIILERATKVRPLGSILSLGPNILPVFEQLGLMEELARISLPISSTDVYDKDLNKLGSIVLRGQKQITGYDNIVFARPKLHDLLQKQVPAHKVLMGKRVIKVEEKQDSVYAHCADETIYHGGILIGADGAYSGVRESLYNQLADKGLLPQTDAQGPSVGYACIVGVACPKDVSKYPQLQNRSAYLTSVLGGDRRLWAVNNVPGNQLCWALFYQFTTTAEFKAQQCQNSEWGAKANISAMTQQYYDLPCPYGGTVGELIDATPKDLISKVFCEEKLFETWFCGRTVLIGDACHKMLPGAGQGAINAMQDAVILANCLYDLEDSAPASIAAAFQDYRDQRYPHARAMSTNSRFISTVMGGQDWWERLLRHVLFHYIPDWLQQWVYGKMAEYRPQITWLPLVENRGTGYVIPQKPSRRYTEEQTPKHIECQ